MKILESYRILSLSLILIGSLAMSCERTKSSNLTADEIIDAYIMAKGGEEKLKTVKSIRMILEAKEKNLVGESLRVFPDKLCDIFTYPGGQNKVILNGVFAKLVQPDTVITISDPIIRRNLFEDALIFSLLYSEKLGEERRFVGETTINDRLHYEVQIIYQDNTAKSYFFDAETLLLGKVTDEFRSSRVYSNYMNVSGIQVPHRIKSISPTDTSYFVLTQIELNPEIDDKIFEVNSNSK